MAVREYVLIVVVGLAAMQCRRPPQTTGLRATAEGLLGRVSDIECLSGPGDRFLLCFTHFADRSEHHDPASGRIHFVVLGTPEGDVILQDTIRADRISWHDSSTLRADIVLGTMGASETNYKKRYITIKTEPNR